jgi:hypothetical protein
LVATILIPRRRSGTSCRFRDTDFETDREMA